MRAAAFVAKIALIAEQTPAARTHAPVRSPPAAATLARSPPATFLPARSPPATLARSPPATLARSLPAIPARSSHTAAIIDRNERR